MSVRRAFVWASAGRYLTMAINLVATLILARLLAPQEYGVTVVGGAVFAVAEALRALGGGAYLIQKQDLAQDDIRACFTVSFLATVFITGLLLLLAEPLARFFCDAAIGALCEGGGAGLHDGTLRLSNRCPAQPAHGLRADCRGRGVCVGDLCRGQRRARAAWLQLHEFRLGKRGVDGHQHGLLSDPVAGPLDLQAALAALAQRAELRSL